jgi:hypothetical protein
VSERADATSGWSDDAGLSEQGRGPDTRERAVLRLAGLPCGLLGGVSGMGHGKESGRAGLRVWVLFPFLFFFSLKLNYLNSKENFEFKPL